jgi:esterase/lipase
MKNLTKITTLLILLFLALLYLAGSYLTHANLTTIGSLPTEIKNAKEVSFLSRSGADIRGWLLKSKNEKGGVLLLHGVRSNRLQMLDRAKFLQKAGYTVLLIDFQAHGESSGEEITFGHLESLDASSAYSYLEGEISTPNIGVIGVSLGGAALLLGDVKLRAKAVVLESVYPTIKEAIDDRLKIYFGSIGHYLSPLLTLQLKPRMNITINALRPIDHIGKVKGSVMIIAGDKDRHTTLSESKRLFMEAKEPKELWVVKGAKHINFSTYKPKKYQKKILNFLNRRM